MQIKWIIAIFWLAADVDTSGIEDKVTEYFKSDIFKAFQKHWRTYRNSFENAIVLALKESYGYGSMNVYVRRSADALKVCDGLYGSDSVVDRLLSDITLSGLPNLIQPEVTFALAFNVLYVEAGLSKMILEAKYNMFRNHSDVVYTAEEQTKQKSPYSYVQVQPSGDIAIIAEDCMIDGYVLTKLSGTTINVGHDTFRVKNCKFSIEISTKDQPPIIAPYFTADQSKQFQRLLTVPIRAEMLPKLQAAVFSFINTSVVFGDYLSKSREYQNNMFKDVIKHISDIVIAIDNKTVESNLATLDANPLSLTWDAKCPEEFCQGEIIVDNVTVHGLDTLYSSHTGGHSKMISVTITESFRFHSLMVRGSITFKNSTSGVNHAFVAEIHDVSVDFEIDLEKSETKFEVLGWRSMVISRLVNEYHLSNRKVLSSFIHGYIENTLPSLLSDHLTSMYNSLHTSQPIIGNATKCDCGNENKNKD